MPAITVAGLVLIVVGLCVYNGYAMPLPNNALQNVPAVRIQDDWEGYSTISPVTVHAGLTFQNGMWRGPVVLFVDRHMNLHGKDILDTQQKTVSTTVPNVVMQKFFRTLQRLPLRRGTYSPAVTHTDDHPMPTIIVQTSTQTVTFHSDSNTPDRVPWQVKTADGNFVTNSDAPDTALALLRPYLHRGKFKELETSAVKHL